MSWRNSLRKASFRGVPFFVDGVEGEFGRRTVTHEYPLRDKPYVEDLGRRARSFNVEAYVLATPANGMNYMPGRDALIAAIEQAGPGVLVHPYLGELRVSISGAAKLRETTAEGGMARFTLAFIESGEAAFPASGQNTRSVVSRKADAAEAALINTFSKSFNVKGKPGWVGASATALLKTASDYIGSLPSIARVDPGQMAEFLPAVATFKGSVETAAGTPGDLARSMLGVIDRVRNLGSAAGLRALSDDSMRMLRKLFTFGETGSSTAVTSVPATTASRQQQADNQQATVGMVQTFAVVAAARRASELDYAALQDATDVRDELVGRLDGLMDSTESDEMYAALLSMRAAVVGDINARGAERARLVSYTPIDTVPALVLAHQLYGDATRDEEIVSRNRVRHPGFVLGGRSIEVLADA